MFNKKSSLVLILLFIISCGNIKSQSRSASAVYLEVGGNAVLYSINYDRLLHNNFGIRAGLMAFGYASSNEGVIGIGIPVLGSYFIGEGNHRLELAFGFTYLTGEFGAADISGKVSEFLPTGSIGYRYQPVDGGFFFKIGFTPINFPYKFLPWGGLGLGYTF